MKNLNLRHLTTRQYNISLWGGVTLVVVALICLFVWIITISGPPRVPAIVSLISGLSFLGFIVCAIVGVVMIILAFFQH